MKLNKSIRLMLIGVMAMSFVACSSPETSKVESGSATPVEEQKDEAEVKQEEVVLVDDELDNSSNKRYFYRRSYGRTYI